MSLRQAGTRSFRTSTIPLKVKPPKTATTSLPKPEEATASEPAIRLTNGLSSLKKTDYSQFMQKIQKLNPDMQFTETIADIALERSLALQHPPVVLEMAQRAMEGEIPKGISQGSRRQLANGKRLLKESEEYWR